MLTFFFCSVYMKSVDIGLISLINYGLYRPVVLIHALSKGTLLILVKFIIAFIPVLHTVNSYVLTGT